MRGSDRVARWFILGGVCSALITALTLYWGESSWRDLIEALSHIKTHQAVLIIASSGITLILRAQRLRVLFESLNLKGALSVCASHNALTRLLPARSGELSLPLYLQRQANVPLAEGALTLLWIRLAEVMCLGLITLCVALSVASGVSSGVSPDATTQGELKSVIGLNVTSVMIIGVITLLATIALRYARVGLTHVTKLASRISSDVSHRVPTLHTSLKHIESRLNDAPRLCLNQSVRIGLCTVIILINQAWLFSIFLDAVGAHLPLSQVILGSAAVHLAGVLPAPTIGNVGTHELGWTVAYVQLGVPLVAAGASALLSQWLTLALACVWWALLRSSVSPAVQSDIE